MAYKPDLSKAVQEIMAEEDQRVFEALNTPHCLKCFNMYKVIKAGNTKIYQHSQEDCDNKISEQVVNS